MMNVLNVFTCFTHACTFKYIYIILHIYDIYDCYIDLFFFFIIMLYLSYYVMSHHHYSISLILILYYILL